MEIKTKRKNLSLSVIFIVALISITLTLSESFEEDSEKIVALFEIINPYLYSISDH